MKRKQNSLKVVNRLVTDNFGLARFWAAKYAWRYGFNDALSIAMEGLLLAAQRWETILPFGTYASCRIKWRFSREYQREKSKMRGGTGRFNTGVKAKWISLDEPAGFYGKTHGDFLEDARVVMPSDLLSVADGLAADKAEVGRLLATLSVRDAEIMRLRYGFDGCKPLFLEELGQRFGLSRERIRQIEDGALRKFWRLKDRKALTAVSAADLARGMSAVA